MLQRRIEIKILIKKNCSSRIILTENGLNWGCMRNRSEITAIKIYVNIIIFRQISFWTGKKFQSCLLYLPLLNQNPGVCKNIDTKFFRLFWIVSCKFVWMYNIRLEIEKQIKSQNYLTTSLWLSTNIFLVRKTLKHVSN
jgi:hypothetical protein